MTYVGAVPIDYSVECTRWLDTKSERILWTDDAPSWLTERVARAAKALADSEPYRHREETSTRVAAKLCALVADQFGHTLAHKHRTCAELAGWVACKKGHGTWACEVGGLRLRAGVSVPGWVTADARGRLLAVKGTGRDERLRLIRAVAEADRGREVGLRARTRPPAWQGRVMVSGAIGVRDICDQFWADQRGADELALQLDMVWHMVRTNAVVIDRTTTLHSFAHGCQRETPFEIGAGAVAGYIADGECMMLIVPAPDSDPRRDVELKARAADIVHQLRSGKTAVPVRAANVLQQNGARCVRIEVARFDIVP